MRPFDTMRKSRFTRLVLLVMAVSMAIAACSSNSDSFTAVLDGSEEAPLVDEVGGDQLAPEGEGAYKTVVQDGRVVFESTAVSNVDAKIIKDGSPPESTGHNGAKMEVWGNKLEAKTIAEITAYIISKNEAEFAKFAQ